MVWVNYASLREKEQHCARTLSREKLDEIETYTVSPHHRFGQGQFDVCSHVSSCQENCISQEKQCKCIKHDWLSLVIFHSSPLLHG